MIKVKNLAVASLTVLFLGTVALAQNRGGQDDPCAAACGTGGCAGCTAAPFVIILFFLALIILNVALLIWVARDAKARGLDNSVMWMILVMFTGLLGFVIYIFSRPQGNIVQCPNCKNNRLQASATCPHCGNA
jgi:uncharacterized membrane protein YhaH (DUF805 family)